jgi:hypothetical protein
MSKVDEAVTKITEQIAVESRPGKMTIGEARELYELLADWLEGSLGALGDEEP